MPKPTSYKPEYCKRLVEHMSEGLSYASFAPVIKVARSTMYEWQEKHPEWVNAKALGEDACLLFWERLGRSLAAGKLKGCAASFIFNMKNRFNWRDKKELSGEAEGIKLIVQDWRDEDDEETKPAKKSKTKKV